MDFLNHDNDQDRADQKILRRVKEDGIRLTLLSFDADTAWELGSTIRTLAFANSPDKPVAISITHANSDQPLFFACSSPGVAPDSMHLIETMRNAVKRWGKSTMYLGKQDPSWVSLSDTWGARYAFVPGAWPIKVKGVEGVVAVVVVYGSAEDEHVNNHQLIVQALEVVLRRQCNPRSYS